MQSPRPLAAAAAAVLLTALVVSMSARASAATVTTLYAAPAGSGSTCSQFAPCSLTGAQAAVESLSPSTTGASVTVDLVDGTYRLSNTWQLGAADSGSPGKPVVWQAAPGAHPVLSGASQITGWTQVGSSAVWSAPVPSGSASRQLYVNGREAPIAQDSPGALGFAGGWTGTSTGYNISGDGAATTWFAGLSAARVAAVEFDYPAANGSWTESRCRVASYSGGTLTMDEPCWADVTARSSFSQGSGGLPSMSQSQMPALIEDAQALLNPGQWFLDTTANTLYYEPFPGQQINSLDVELPRLQQLVVGAGTLAAPLHDLTFQGIEFSYATWNAPSSPSGFADVQSNLTMTAATNQGMCKFSSPAGSCPWGALSQPLANVTFSAADNVTIADDQFTDLGGAGLGVMYGSDNTLIQGDEFSDIASTGILLGCTADPNPTNPNPATDPDTASVIKQDCTPNPSAVAGDTIGTNEILTGTTVQDNVIHNVGTDYSSAAGITLLFSQHTTISHNDLYDLPYDGITAGVIQGHVDQASTPQNTTNVNQNNTISGNVFHNYLQVRSDGGAIYAEGHQAQYYNASGGLLPDSQYAQADPTQTLAHGLQVTGNVAYNGGNTDFTYYDDAGSEWINWQGDAAFNGGANATGGCSATGHFWVTGGYFSASVGAYVCDAPTDTHASGNTAISSSPGPTDLPVSLLSSAGVASSFATTDGPSVYYVSPVSSANQVLIAGDDFTSTTPVYVNGSPASGVQYLSSGFLIAPVPAGTTNPQITVGNPVSMYHVNDTDPAIAYDGFSTSSGRTFGDFDNDVHYATANGSTATYTFTGTTIQVYGEQYTDQGNLGISIDGGTQQSVSTVPADGQRHADTVVYTAGGLTSGSHTIVITKLSGTYATLDGFGAPSLRVGDGASSISYDGFSVSSNRGFGDYGDQLHYATANGSAATYSFTGSFIQVYGEQYTDQGNLGISIDGGAQLVVETYSYDGQRHANVPVFAASGLSTGPHTIVVTKLSGTYATLNGFATPISASTGGPFGGTPTAIPGTMQAANYDTGGEGTAYNVSSVNGSANSYRSDGVDLETCSDAGCGYDIGWTGTGQWFNYTVDVASAGTYTVGLRLASPNGQADALHIANAAGTNLSGAIAASNTGGWQTWATSTASVTLPAGTQTLTLYQDNGGWNIHQLTFAITSAHSALRAGSR